MITSMDGLLAGTIGIPTVIGKDAGTAEQAGIPHTPWYQSGIIGAGAAPTGGLGGAAFSAPVGGQIPVPVAVAGAQSQIQRLSLVHAGGIGMAWLIDRMWGNVPVVTTTTAQAITPAAMGPRDYTGTANGERVYLALECSAVTGNAAPITNTTVSYTNSSGVAGRTATLASWPTTAVAGTFVPFALQAGDTGVRSVQSITLGTSYLSGQVHLIAFRWVCDLELPNPNVANKAAFPSIGKPILWDFSVLQLVYWPTGTALGAVAGSITYAQG